VLGSNGVGKSTLNRTISGIVRARARQPSASTAPPSIARSRRRSSSAGSSTCPRAGGFSQPVGRRKPRPRQLSPRRERRARQPRPRVRDLPAPPSSAAAQRAGTLSGGEQQMLAIGRGLMAEPRLLILDEPSLGLSPLLVEELFALIARIHAEGVAVLLVEQNVVQSLRNRAPRLYPRRGPMRHVRPLRRHRRRSTTQTRLSGTLTHVCLRMR
jgi:branched-chain amino acid transport system ATP-binding protein